VIAFARTLAGDGRSAARVAIVVAPHLAAHVIDAQHPVPIADVWKTSRVHLPAALASLTYRDVFTGAEIKPVRSESSAWIFVGQALQTLPVGLLVGA
jgi:maltooligosyltrehalose synthase